jgi:hypothetical protein
MQFLCRYLLVQLLIALPAGATTRYIAPAGSNAANGQTAGTAWLTFAYAFGQIVGGDTLIAVDGNYTTGTNGTIAVPPSGTAADPTLIQAQNRHAAVLAGASIAIITGRNYITLDGLKLTCAAGQTAMTIGVSGQTIHHISVKNSAVYKSARTGTEPAATITGTATTDCLIEDSWFYGTAIDLFRVIQTRQHTLRRCVFRNDAGNYGTMYTSLTGIKLDWAKKCLVENCVVFDNNPITGNAVSPVGIQLQGDYGFPASPSQCDSNQLLGCITLNIVNADPTDFIHNEAQGILLTASCQKNILRNCAAWSITASYGDGIYVNTANGARNSVLHCTAGRCGNAGFIGTDFDSLVGSQAINNSAYGVQSGENGALPFDYNYISNPGSYGNYYGINPGLNDITLPTFAPDYFARVDFAAAKGNAYDGGDRGATIINRYVDGVLTDDLLWPWPNEALIKADFHDASEGRRGKWYDTVSQRTKSLTEYIWEYEGKTNPYKGRRVFFVDDAGNDAAVGDESRPLLTLQAAMGKFAAADSNCIIKVFPGNYSTAGTNLTVGAGLPFSSLYQLTVEARYAGIKDSMPAITMTGAGNVVNVNNNYLNFRDLRFVAGNAVQQTLFAATGASDYLTVERCIFDLRLSAANSRAVSLSANSDNFSLTNSIIVGGNNTAATGHIGITMPGSATSNNRIAAVTAVKVRAFLDIPAGNSFTNFSFVNNLLDSAAFGFVTAGGSFSPTNCFIQSPDPSGCSGAGCAVVAYTNCQRSTVTHIPFISWNTASADFAKWHGQGLSRNNGTTGVAVPITDFYGKQRPTEYAADIGATEYQPGPVPENVTNLDSLTIGEDTLRVTWAAPAGGWGTIDSVLILYRTDGNFPTSYRDALATRAGAVQRALTSLKVTGLTAGTLYYFCAFTQNLEGDWSIYTVPARDTVRTHSATQPPPPTNIALTAIGDSQISITWTPSISPGLDSTMVIVSDQGHFVPSPTNVYTGDTIVFQVAGGSATSCPPLQRPYVQQKTRYYITVFQSRNGLWSTGVLHGSQDTITVPDITPPANVTNFLATVRSDSLRWGKIWQNYNYRTFDLVWDTSASADAESLMIRYNKYPPGFAGTKTNPATKDSGTLLIYTEKSLDSMVYPLTDAPYVDYYFSVFVRDSSGLWSAHSAGSFDSTRSLDADTTRPQNVLACSSWVSTEFAQMSIRVSGLTRINSLANSDAKQIGIWWDYAESLGVRIDNGLTGPSLSTHGLILDTAALGGADTYLWPDIFVGGGRSFMAAVAMADTNGNWSLVDPAVQGWIIYVPPPKDTVPPHNLLSLAKDSAGQYFVRLRVTRTGPDSSWFGDTLYPYYPYGIFYSDTGYVMGNYHALSSYPRIDSSAYGTSYRVISGLQRNRQYYFSVAVRDGHGLWSVIDGKDTLNGPAETLSVWTTIDIDSVAPRDTFNWAVTPGQTMPGCSVAVVSYNAPPLLPSPGTPDHLFLSVWVSPTGYVTTFDTSTAFLRRRVDLSFQRDTLHNLLPNTRYYVTCALRDTAHNWDTTAFGSRSSTHMFTIITALDSQVVPAPRNTARFLPGLSVGPDSFIVGWAVDTSTPVAAYPAVDLDSFVVLMGVRSGSIPQLAERWDTANVKVYRAGVLGAPVAPGLLYLDTIRARNGLLTMYDFTTVAIQPNTSYALAVYVRTALGSQGKWSAADTATRVFTTQFRLANTLVLSGDSAGANFDRLRVNIGLGGINSTQADSIYLLIKEAARVDSQLSMNYDDYLRSPAVRRGKAVAFPLADTMVLIDTALAPQTGYLVTAFVKGTNQVWTLPGLAAQTVIFTGRNVIDTVPAANPFVISSATFADIHHLQVAWSGQLSLPADTSFRDIILAIDSVMPDTANHNNNQVLSQALDYAAVDTSLRSFVFSKQYIQPERTYWLRLYTRDHSGNLSLNFSLVQLTNALTNPLHGALQVQVYSPDSAVLRWNPTMLTDPYLKYLRVVLHSPGLGDSTIVTTQVQTGYLTIMPIRSRYGDYAGNAIAFYITMGGLKDTLAPEILYSAVVDTFYPTYKLSAPILAIQSLAQGAGNRVRLYFTVMDSSSNHIVTVRGEFFSPSDPQATLITTGMIDSGARVFRASGADLAGDGSARVAMRDFPYDSLQDSVWFRLTGIDQDLQTDTVILRLYLDNMPPESLTIFGYSYDGVSIKFRLAGRGMDSVRYGADSLALLAAPWTAYVPNTELSVPGPTVFFQGRDKLGNNTKIRSFQYQYQLIQKIKIDNNPALTASLNEDLWVTWNGNDVSWNGGDIVYSYAPVGVRPGITTGFGNSISIQPQAARIFTKGGMQMALPYTVSDSLAYQLRMYRLNPNGTVDIISLNGWSANPAANWLLDTVQNRFIVNGVFPDSGVYFLGLDDNSLALDGTALLQQTFKVINDSLLLPISVTKYASLNLPCYFRFRYLGEPASLPHPELKLGQFHYTMDPVTGQPGNDLMLTDSVFLSRVKMEGLILELTVTDGKTERRLVVSVPVEMEGGVASTPSDFSSWRLVGLPGLPLRSSASVPGILFDAWNPDRQNITFDYASLKQSKKLCVLRYFQQGDSLGYHEYQDTADTVQGYYGVRPAEGFRVETGRAFWVIRDTTTSLQVKGQELSTPGFLGRGYVLRNLGQRGGVDVCLPYNFSICIGDIMEATLGHSRNAGDTAAFLQQFKFYRWVRSGTALTAVPFSPLSGIDLGDSLQTFAGYTVLITDTASTLDSLVIPPVRSSNSIFRQINILNPKTGSVEGSWGASVRLHTGTGNTGTANFGLSGSRWKGKVLSFPLLRANAVQGARMALVERDGSAYTRLFNDRLVGGGTEWLLTVENRGPRDFSGTLDFDGLAGVPESLGIVVMDRSMGFGQDLRTGSQCEVALAKGEVRTYAILAGSKDYLERKGYRPAPAEFRLLGNSPNPFNPVTRIEYQLPLKASGKLLDGNTIVRLVIYDIRGRQVCDLVNGRGRAGYYRAIWRGVDKANRTVASGVYFYRLQVRDKTGNALFTKIRKMVMIK